MKAARQIECAMLMIDINDFTAHYVQALLESSDINQLVEPPKPKLKGAFTRKSARMQDEMSKLERDYKLIKDNRGQKNLALQFMKNYLVRLLNNARITKFLDLHHPDILEEFQKIVDMKSINTNNVAEEVS